MRSGLLTALAVLAPSSAARATGAVEGRAAQHDATAQAQLFLLSKQASDNVLAALACRNIASSSSWPSPAASVIGAGSKPCTLDTLKIRREWGSLSAAEQISYLDAVQCLQRLPAKTPATLVPGAKSRFDDFVATHINQTLSIHYTGNFLGWHRYFTWLYESALQTECGYNGTQPYWDWGLSATSGLSKSPMFDGSNTSFSGDGVPVPNQGQVVLGASLGLPPIYLDPGTGGGCVTSGPFVNMTVNLGPVALDVPGNQSVAAANPLAYNPRCLKRSLTDTVLRNFSTSSHVLDLITKTTTIDAFQMTLQGVPGTGQMGVHGGGHYALGGDPARDVSSSPGDPAFYALHAMIDRTWWMWQWQDPADRTDVISGTRSFLNKPPTPNATLDDYVSFGYAGGPPRQLRELTSTVAGPFCYIYL